jgi:hypothetical protein
VVIRLSAFIMVCIGIQILERLERTLQPAALIPRIGKCVLAENFFPRIAKPSAGDDVF